MKKIQLYNQENISSIQWPSTTDGQYSKEFLVPFIKNRPQYYIDNVDTQMLALQLGDLILPVTVNESEYENSYVCSPYNHYITYGKEELPMLGNRGLEIPLAWLLSGLGLYLKQGLINRVVIVNNWLFSTNLYPPITTEQLEVITKELVTLFPDHAILFRSVTDEFPPRLKTRFEELEYDALFSRQVYLFDPFCKEALRSKNIKWDMRLLDAAAYEVIDTFSINEIPRLVELYNLLYLDKYSRNNPQFNEMFVHLALQHGLLTIKGLKKENRIDGVLGYFTRNGAMTTPFLGYDTTLPPETGLYRMVSAQLVREAHAKNLLLHQSSGAASFKKFRKAYPIPEYTMVYTKHLPKNRQVPWSRLIWLMNRIAKPLLGKYEL